MSRKRRRIIIFTDLDGTLLDRDDYSFEEALPSLQKIRRKKIPLILCSSKTRAELELYQRKLKLSEPFISENGGAIFVPVGYFQHMLFGVKRKRGYLVLELGTPYKEIRKNFLQIMHRLNLKARGFGDMKADEISSLVNLNRTEAKLAQKREYDEPFYFLEETQREKIKFAEKEFKKIGLALTSGGWLFHLTGGNDKGKAVKLLIRIYKSNWGDNLLIIGLGDSRNDLSLLESVDIPVLIKKKDKTYDSNVLKELKVYQAPGIGPQGWNQAVLDLVTKYSSDAD